MNLSIFQQFISPTTDVSRSTDSVETNPQVQVSTLSPDIVAYNRLYQFILTKISGEPRTAIAHRNLESWDELKEFLKNTYIEKRTLDFHANQLFWARQNKSENISEWIQKIQTLGSKFRESALQDCTKEERAGILTLADKLRKICFIQGLCSDRIQTIVRSRKFR